MSSQPYQSIPTNPTQPIPGEKIESGEESQCLTYWCWTITVITWISLVGGVGAACIGGLRRFCILLHYLHYYYVSITNLQLLKK